MQKFVTWLVWSISKLNFFYQLKFRRLMVQYLTPGVLGRNGESELSQLNQRIALGQKCVIAGDDGWLTVKLEPSGARISLPEYLQVDHIETKRVSLSSELRDYFIILEGAHRGRTASVRREQGRSSLGRPVPKYTGGARLKFDMGKKLLRYNDQNFAAKSDTNNTTPRGKHKIRIPDYPHHGGLDYADRSSKATVWFYIGPGEKSVEGGGKSFYLHPGSGSLGCVTVTDIALWDLIYKQLIVAREGDGLSVGTIEVFN